MKILFAGGGSLGPVTPLLAVMRAARRLAPDTAFAWAGTPDGPERNLVEAESLTFYPVPVAKIPRHPDMRWLTFPFDYWRARRSSKRILDGERPDAVVSAGGYTAVPVMRAAAKRGIPCFIHQLDVVPTWSNRVVAKLCSSRTSSFRREGYDSAPTPTRFHPDHLPPRAEAAASFDLDPARPITLVVGGGQGAAALNRAVRAQLEAWLTNTQIIHVCGRGKAEGLIGRSGYAVRELLGADGMGRAFAASDLVVTRGGIGLLSEIASLSKPAIVVPIPDSHQEENAKAFEAAHAALYVHQNRPHFEEALLKQVLILLEDTEKRRKMGERAARFFPTDDGTALATRILKKNPR